MKYAAQKPNITSGVSNTMVSTQTLLQPHGLKTDSKRKTQSANGRPCPGSLLLWLPGDACSTYRPSRLLPLARSRMLFAITRCLTRRKGGGALEKQRCER